MSASEGQGEVNPLPAVPEAPAASQELERLVNPLNGEILAPDDLAGIAKAVEQMREAKRNLDAFITVMTDAVAAQSRIHGTRTFHLDDRSLVLSGDTELEWDIGLLNEGLARAGCPEERLYDLIKTTVTYKVDQAVAKQLSSANPDYKAAIEAAQTRTPKRPSLSVKR